VHSERSELGQLDREHAFVREKLINVPRGDKSPLSDSPSLFSPPQESHGSLSSGRNIGASETSIDSGIKDGDKHQHTAGG
jgi:hypothetical protein